MYTVKNLGTLSPGSVTVALAINNSGQVVGGSGGHAFLYSGGGLVDLGVPSGWDTSSAFGINSAGQITITATHGVSPGGFVYSNGGFTNIGNLGGDVLASGINDSGEVVGYAATPTGNHVVVYSAGTLQDLGNLGASAGAIAYGINNAGQITGFLNRGSGASSQFQAYLYSNGTAKNLGTLGGTSSIGYAINNLGQVAGGASLPPLSLGSPEPGHAFLDTNGIMKDLDPGGGATGSVGLGINDLGDVVGYKYFGGNQSATLWRGGQIINLNSVVQGTSDLTLDAAYGINDSGWIVGSGSTASGDQHAFLAIPTPEPSAAALLLLWTALLLRRRRAGRW